jgi:peptide/nickel transport system substrate-binding protein
MRRLFSVFHKPVRAALALFIGSSGLVAIGSGALGSSASASTTNITYALLPATLPNYIFPVMGSAYYSNVNLYQFQAEMFRPLYWFGSGTSPTFNASLSLANTPVYSNGGKTMTITMKPYKWSNGKSVTSADVLFFMDMLKAEKKIWPIYVPGEFPDNVVSMSAPNASTVVFKLDKAYSTTWMLYNELSQITPLPASAWDKTSNSGSVGNNTATTAGAQAVWKYLTAQSSSAATYATNPLWQVVDGPFKLKTFDATTGFTVFVPNKSYSGAVKATYGSLTLQPFTTDAAEYNALRAGTVDYGYIPPQDSNQISLLSSQGFQSSPWVGWGINYFPFNYNNPTVGPIFKQLYFRQAIQQMVDQPTDVKKALYGYGYPTYGPVPIEPKSNLSTAQEASNPYPFNPAKSKALLVSHGWAVKPGGTTTCANPGTGANQCGAGIAKGEKLSFNFLYATGFTFLAQEMLQLKSNLALDGIQLNLTTAPPNTVSTNDAQCNGGPSCSWQMGDWGIGWSYGPDYYPTGESIFATGSAENFGSYSNPTNDANINATHTVSGTAVLGKYENYLATQLPVIWMPEPNSQISEIRSTLKGVTQSPLLNFTPEYWTLSK